MRSLLTIAGVLGVTCATGLADTPVYVTGAPTGYFTPFNSSTVAGTKYGDSGWFGGGGDAPVALSSITLGLATSSATGGAIPQGKTDIKFTFNDGDPSGLVFGPGTALYSTTLTDVTLPAASGGAPSYFSLTIPLPGTMTSGGFNNIGFSVGVENFNYTGSFGFQNRGGFNSLGFYTNNYSTITPPGGWNLFSFGPNDPADIGNFLMTVTVPEPTTGLASILLTGVIARRRRQTA